MWDLYSPDGSSLSVDRSLFFDSHNMLSLCLPTQGCVGHHNAPHFIRFLYSVNAAMVYHMALIWSFVLDPYHDISTLQFAIIAINFALAFPVFLSVFLFSIHHTYLMLQNITTIERWEKQKVQKAVQQRTIADVPFPFTLSSFQNIASILGSQPHLWLWPGRPSPGHGYDFPKSPGLGWSYVSVRS